MGIYGASFFVYFGGPGLLKHALTPPSVPRPGFRPHLFQDEHRRTDGLGVLMIHPNRGDTDTHLHTRRTYEVL